MDPDISLESKAELNKKLDDTYGSSRSNRLHLIDELQSSQTTTHTTESENEDDVEVITPPAAHSSRSGTNLQDKVEDTRNEKDSNKKKKEVSSGCSKCKEMKRKLDQTEEEVAEMKLRILERIPTVLDRIEEVLQPEDSAATPAAMNAEANITSKKIEVHPGSGVLISNTILDLAGKQQGGMGGFVRTLLISLFSEEELKTSNLRGGKSKINPAEQAKAALDSTKLDAMYAATLSRFPDTSKSDFGTVISAKLTQVQRKTGKQ